MNKITTWSKILDDYDISKDVNEALEKREWCRPNRDTNEWYMIKNISQSYLYEKYGGEFLYDNIDIVYTVFEKRYGKDMFKNTIHFSYYRDTLRIRDNLHIDELFLPYEFNQIYTNNTTIKKLHVGTHNLAGMTILGDNNIIEELYMDEDTEDVDIEVDDTSVVLKITYGEVI